MSDKKLFPAWVAIDWGTSNLRFWAMSKQGDVIQQGSVPKGMAGLAPNEFEPTLMSVLEPILHPSNPVHVLCCGMAGSRQGWHEAPYVTTPCPPPDQSIGVDVPTANPRLHVKILPGIKQLKPADVMRGEETQIAGVLLERPDFDGVICMPGTHTKWVHISAGEIVSFQTFMTGEIFALLSKNSILQHSISNSDWNRADFTGAVNDAVSNPKTIAAQLFSLRAQGLVGQENAPDARSRLSGLLIGLELAGARPYWLGQNVILVGEEGIANAYLDALTDLGAMAEILPSKDITLSGLKFAYQKQKEAAQ
ncbi:MAG: 2-dehydro-3-deoxygalactonokinase [Paracoccaceae bacterium]|nr:2-dehydro-3-deoxygalactonokinase [Paracoccaceae bacterium]